MQSKLNSIFETFEKLNPHPKTELVYTNDFTLLVAVILSAQATDKQVNIATKDLFANYDTPKKILKLGIEGLKKYIQSINYFPTKAKNIITLSEILVKEHLSSIPDNMRDLTALPGVGRKTANVVLNCAFGAAVMPVDTHIFRVTKRLGIAHGATPEKVEAELMKIIPDKWLGRAHHWLVLHGRYICKARIPLCTNCPVNQWCEYYQALQ